MQFCEECNNMLYPKESNRQLLYACRHCDFEKPAENPRVFVEDFKNEGQTSELVVNSQITLDPSLPRTYEIDCEKCGHNEVVFYQPSKGNMSLLFVCTNKACYHFWR